MFSTILKQQNTLQTHLTRNQRTEGSRGAWIEVRWRAPKTHLLIYFGLFQIWPFYLPHPHIHLNTHIEKPPDTHSTTGLFWTQGEPKLAGRVISGGENAWNDNDFITASSAEERPVLSEEDYFPVVHTSENSHCDEWGNNGHTCVKL